VKKVGFKPGVKERERVTDAQSGESKVKVRRHAREFALL